MNYQIPEDLWRSIDRSNALKFGPIPKPAWFVSQPPKRARYDWCHVLVAHSEDSAELEKKIDRAIDEWVLDSYREQDPEWGWTADKIKRGIIRDVRWIGGMIVHRAFYLDYCDYG